MEKVYCISAGGSAVDKDPIEKEENYRTGLFERYNRRYNEDTMTQNVTTMDHHYLGHHQWAMTIHNTVF